MQSFLAELRTQRWDDHRYYHHSRINQSLHFLSAVSFLVAYAMMFKDPVKSALIGWLVVHGEPAVRPFLLRAQGLRHGQSVPPTSTRKTSRWATT